MGIKQTGVTAGGALAGLTLPTVAALTNWRAAIAVTTVFLCAVAWWGMSTRTTNDRKPLVLRDPVTKVNRRGLAFYGFMMSGTQLLVFAYTAVFLVDHVSWSPQVAGVGLTVVLAAGTLGRVGWGAVSDRDGDRVRVLQIAASGSALAMLLLPFVSGFAIWLILLAVGLCTVGWNGAFLALVAESAGARGVGRATSSVYTFVYAGSIALPPLLGFVVTATSWRWFWLIAATGAALSAAVIRIPAATPSLEL
jgi:MFS family permease